jgi:hypothetical protein
MYNTLLVLKVVVLPRLQSVLVQVPEYVRRTVLAYVRAGGSYCTSHSPHN